MANVTQCDNCKRTTSPEPAGTYAIGWPHLAYRQNPVTFRQLDFCSVVCAMAGLAALAAEEKETALQARAILQRTTPDSLRMFEQEQEQPEPDDPQDETMHAQPHCETCGCDLHEGLCPEGHRQPEQLHVLHVVDDPDAPDHTGRGHAIGLSVDVLGSFPAPAPAPTLRPGVPDVVDAPVVDDPNDSPF